MNTRILAISTETGEAVGQYVCQFDDVNEFDPSAEGNTGLMKLSGIVAIDETRFIVIERIDPVAKLYIVDISGATDLAGGEFRDPATSSSLEQSNDLTAISLTPVTKALLLDRNTIREWPIKIEGVAIIDPTKIAIANDNDFDINEPAANGDNFPTGKTSQIFVISVPEL